jgi:hypothetical protein
VVSFFLAFATNPICIPVLPMPVIWAALLILPDVIILIMLGEWRLQVMKLPHAVFRYRKKQIFSVLPQWPLVSQEGYWAMNRMLSNDFDTCREEHLYKTALMS